MNRPMIAYKLTDENMQTHRGFQWEMNKKVITNGKGELCGPGWLHFYSHPLLAVLLNSIHADIPLGDLRLFEAEVGGKKKEDKGLKEGWTEAMLVREIPVPHITANQRIAFTLFCMLEASPEPAFVSWAEGWLSGKYRTETMTAKMQWEEEERMAAAWGAREWESAEARAVRWQRMEWRVVSAERVVEWAERAVELAVVSARVIDLEKLAKKAMKF